MKKFSLVFLSTLLLGAVTSCSMPGSPNKVSGNDVEKVTLDVSYMKLEEGETLQLHPTIKYYNDQEIEVFKMWRTSNSKVATVDENGLVYAVGGGSATITYLVGVTKSAACVIEVPKQDQGGGDDPGPVTPGEFAIRLNTYSQELKFHQTYQLVATTTEDAEVTWAVTEGGTVVSVDANGLVTAGAVVGQAKVTATAKDKSVSCTFTVVDEGDDEEDKTVKLYFFIDYANVDETDKTGTKLIATFKWYPDRVLTNDVIPANPKTAPTSDFPYFIGWSTRAIVDDKDGLIDWSTYTTGDTRNYVYIFGIWSDVTRENF